jgi:GDP-L-fucose synthase
MTIAKIKVLVTGGSGLVGHAIQNIQFNYLKYSFVFATSKECNLTKYEETYNYFKQIKPDYVIHLAANVGGLYKNMNQKLTMLDDNMNMNMNVLKCCHLFNVKKVVSCLSTCIFPDKTTYPINEDMLHDGPPHHSNDAYAYSKRLLDIYSKMYREQYGKQFICVIPTNIYGPHDNYHLENAHVIPALIHQCYLAKKENRPFIVRGDGSPLRQFIYSKDLAKLLIWTLDTYSKCDNLILSVGEEAEVSIGCVAEEIANAMEFPNDIVFDTSYANGQYKKTADNSKLMEELQNTEETFTFTSLSQGIKESVSWFITNYHACRK